ncbi:MAG: nickel pincer cofactor biosynthesis protein LarC [Vulcanimicrobiaceae bacterium]
MTCAHFELVGGASGNMILGALVDAGADLDEIERALRTIPVTGWSLERSSVRKCEIAATYLDFVVPGDDHHAAPESASAHADSHAGSRHLADVLAILERSALTAKQKARARAIYVRLGEAEARVHGTAVDAIHFHEVGATDAILDIAGACVALDLLGVEAVSCSAFPLGRGTIAMRHGRYPNPPPATADLLRGAPTFDAGIAGEMVTTTGAAILTTLVPHPGVRPAMTATALGYGAGRADFPIPNVLRVSLGALAPDATAAATTAARTRSSEVALGPNDGSDEVVVCEATIDDMSPQHFELAIERVLAAGAYDVWLAPVTMKKMRPAVLFGAVAAPASEAAVARAMLAQTTTLGVRVRRERRYALAREIAEVETPLGPVRVKTATVDGTVRRTLEYDDVVRIARACDRPVAEIAARLQEYVLA